MKRYLPFVIVAAVALATLASGTMLYRAKRLPASTFAKNSVASEVGGGESIHVRGHSDAPVTLVEFGDFQCPPCAYLADPINQLERDYRSRLRIVFRHLPLANHQHAREAALASEAAALQGRFWEMHDLLYREQSVWSKAPDVQVLFSAYAGMLGLEIDRFKKDMESEQAKGRVRSDEEQAMSLGVATTPTVFINGQQVSPAYLNTPGLHTAIDAVINEKASK
ncbi:MAG TPA: thioredoxin domain-containing protein [Blastocatellia bacterium]|nr:thioredoxin domain-containing protein [Blastocatellia bacterium]